MNIIAARILVWAHEIPNIYIQWVFEGPIFRMESEPFNTIEEAQTQIREFYPCLKQESETFFSR